MIYKRKKQSGFTQTR